MVLAWRVHTYELSPRPLPMSESNDEPGGLDTSLNLNVFGRKIAAQIKPWRRHIQPLEPSKSCCASSKRATYWQVSQHSHRTISLGPEGSRFRACRTSEGSMSAPRIDARCLTPCSKPAAWSCTSSARSSSACWLTRGASSRTKGPASGADRALCGLARWQSARGQGRGHTRHQVTLHELRERRRWKLPRSH